MDRAQGQSGGQSEMGAMSSQASREDVKQVQEALKNKGHDPGPVDGIMGPNTRQALREFQKENNLQATGRVDDKTASALGVEGSSGGKGSSPSAASSSSEKSSSQSGASSSGSKSTPEKSSSGKSSSSGATGSGGSGSGMSGSGASGGGLGSGTSGSKSQK
jgi:peptidoglycan hydrolase-like protein with peptidoglycan-binding domain